MGRSKWFGSTPRRHHHDDNTIFEVRESQPKSLISTVTRSGWKTNLLRDTILSGAMLVSGKIFDLFGLFSVMCKCTSGWAFSLLNTSKGEGWAPTRYTTENEHDNWKITIFHRRYIFKCFFCFHCHINFCGGGVMFLSCLYRYPWTSCKPTELGGIL